MNINKEFLIWIRFKVFYKLVKIYSKLFINQKIFKINKFSFNNVPEKDSISNFLLKFGMWESKERYLIKFMDNTLSNFVILGIGNIVGWGETLMKEMKEFKVD